MSDEAKTESPPPAPEESPAEATEATEAAEATEAKTEETAAAGETEAKAETSEEKGEEAAPAGEDAAAPSASEAESGAGDRDELAQRLQKLALERQKVRVYFRCLRVLVHVESNSCFIDSLVHLLIMIHISFVFYLHPISKIKKYVIHILLHHGILHTHSPPKNLHILHKTIISQTKY